MKFRTERDGLLDALVTAGRASAARVGMGLGTQSVRLAVHGDELEMTGSDPDLVIEVSQNVSGEQDGSALPSRLVTDIIRAFDAGTGCFGRQRPRGSNHFGPSGVCGPSPHWCGNHSSRTSGV